MDSAEFDYKPRQVKLLSCIFLTDVLCSYRKDDNFRLMDRCLKCPQHARFEREMDEEDAKVDAEIEELHKYGYEFVDRYGKKRGF